MSSVPLYYASTLPQRFSLYSIFLFLFSHISWDWRSVTEDERMYVCVATGELIHPCHYEADFQATPPACDTTPTTTPEPVSARS